MQTKDMTEHQQRIAEFMAKAGQDLPLAPVIPNANTRILRAKLILEEAFETVRALGVTVYHTNAFGTKADRDISHTGNLKFIDNGNADLEEIADGCADISVVTIGTLLACGIADNPILEAVDASNLAKFGPGGHRREDGKWMKRPDWFPPPIAELIEEQRIQNREAAA